MVYFKLNDPDNNMSVVAIMSKEVTLIIFPAVSFNGTIRCSYALCEAVVPSPSTTTTIVLAVVTKAVVTLTVAMLLPTPKSIVAVPEVILDLLLNVAQSVEDKYPLTDSVALGILITGVVPPVDATGEVAVTEVTPVAPSSQEALVPSVFKYLPAFPACDGNDPLD